MNLYKIKIQGEDADALVKNLEYLVAQLKAMNSIQYSSLDRLTSIMHTNFSTLKRIE